MKVHSYTDGKQRATLRIDVPLTRDQMVAALAQHADIHQDTDRDVRGGLLSKEAATAAIRTRITMGGLDGLDYASHASDSCRDWAERQVEQVWPASKA